MLSLIGMGYHFYPLVVLGLDFYQICQNLLEVKININWIDLTPRQAQGFPQAQVHTVHSTSADIES